MIMKLGAAVCVIALCVCCVSIGGHAFLGGFRYADAGKYTAGGAVIDGDVKKLDIHWTDGAVVFVERAGDGIELSETAKKAISGNAQLRWWLDGDTLRVQYAKNGFFSLTGLNKTLTVALPEGMALEDVRVDATSADVKAPGLTADAVAVGLTSGDLELELTGPADSVALSSTSGDLHAALQSAKTISAGTTSGAIDLALAGASDVIAEMISDSPDSRRIMHALIKKTGILRAQAAKEEDSVYRQYYDFSQPVSRLQGHQVLAVNRGEKEGFLKVSLLLDRGLALREISSGMIRSPRSKSPLFR